MKILVTGASGFVGRTLLEYLLIHGFVVHPIFRNHTILSYDNARFCDLRHLESTKKMILDIDPTVIVHCAATSNIEQCEKDGFESWENNVIGTMNLARSAKSKVHFIYLSTAEVFDGNTGLYREDSIRNPVHWYGHTKAASEDIVRKIVPTHTIVRLSYQYGYDPCGKNFIHSVMKRLMRDQEVSAADDLISSPTYVGTTISAIHEMIENQMTGIYNIADRDPYQSIN